MICVEKENAAVVWKEIGYNCCKREILGGVCMDALRKEDIYTIDYIYALPDGERAELIDGHIYYMAPPGRTHQRVLSSIFVKIANYIDAHKGSCEVDIAPFAVFLNNDDINYVEPNILVVCDSSKLDGKGAHVARLCDMCCAEIGKS